MKNILIKSLIVSSIICNGLLHARITGVTPQIQLKNSINNKKNTNNKKKDNNTLIDIGAIKLKVSGYATFGGAAAFSNNEYYDGTNACSSIKTEQKSTSQTKEDKDGLDLVNGEAAVKFKADGKLDNGFDYGALIEIQAEKGDIDIDKAFLTLNQEKFGTLKGGNFKGVDNDYFFSGQQLLEANFGIDGIITSQLNYATGCINPRGPIAFSNKSTKIAYYTPSFGGLQLGVSYTPDTKHFGHDKRDRTIGTKSTGNNTIFQKGDDDKEKPCGINNVAVGIKYDNDFGNGFKLKTGVVFITENTRDITTTCYTGDITSESKSTQETIKLNNAKSWMASLCLTFNKLSIAGGYYNSGKSRLPMTDEYTTKDGKSRIFPAFMIDKDGDAGHAWNVGIKYEFTDKFSMVGVYHNASRNITKGKTANAQVFTIGADYNINKYFKIFGEIDILNSQSLPYSCSMYNLNRKEKDAIIKTKSTLFSAGMTVSF
ncbi:MAG: porin [Alphaproteobacteria bacterium]|nr:porin [Alphaproteobacteria bacterium]